jgi:ParB family chromosome partitioning protein
MNPELKEIEISKIYVSELNVRKMKISKGELESLVQSIKQRGILQPVIVVRRGDKYELPVGQCRFLAAKEAGLKTIPALVYEDLSPADMRVISAIENLQRVNLSPADQAGAIYDLVKEMGSPKAVADALGYTEGWVRYWLGFRGLPDEIKTMVEKKELTTTEATKLRPLLKWKPPQEVVEIAKTIAKYPKKEETRKKAIQVARRIPFITKEELIQRAAEKKPLIILNIAISDAEMESLKRAAEDEDETPQDLAHRIINEWLIENEYLSKDGK